MYLSLGNQRFIVGNVQFFVWQSNEDDSSGRKLLDIKTCEVKKYPGVKFRWNDTLGEVSNDDFSVVPFLNCTGFFGGCDRYVELHSLL